jgi:prephenate dehydratase/chorismate mutase/prephenate dehydratase
MEFALKTRNLKETVTDNKRETEVLENVCRFPQSLIHKDFSQKLFTEIIAESKKLQEKDVTLIGFQGEHGANSEAAARAFDSQPVPIPCPEFIDVFEGLEQGIFDLGIVPVENSLEGAVTEVNDLLITIDSPFKVVGEIKLRIDHCLLTLKDTDYREIKVVYSHPQALAQCRGFISRNKLEARPFYDTAGAARMLSSNRPNAAAAIAGKLCADLYDLEVIKEGIQDDPANFTRFLVIAKEHNGVEGDKCSITFSTRHEAGALYEILSLFSDAGINLTRIESRPLRNDPGNYAFLLDFKGSDKDDTLRGILDTVKEKSVTYKFLGNYMEAQP